jgi:hypothetical protein
VRTYSAIAIVEPPVSRRSDCVPLPGFAVSTLTVVSKYAAVQPVIPLSKSKITLRP